MQGSPIALSRDLDMRFNAITESMREGLSQLIGRVDAYRAAYQSLVATTRADDPSSTELLHDARAHTLFTPQSQALTYDKGYFYPGHGARRARRDP